MGTLWTGHANGRAGVLVPRHFLLAARRTPSVHVQKQSCASATSFMCIITLIMACATSSHLFLRLQHRHTYSYVCNIVTLIPTCATPSHVFIHVQQHHTYSYTSNNITRISAFATTSHCFLHLQQHHIHSYLCNIITRATSAYSFLHVQRQHTYLCTRNNIHTYHYTCNIMHPQAARRTPSRRRHPVTARAHAAISDTTTTSPTARPWS